MQLGVCLSLLSSGLALGDSGCAVERDGAVEEAAADLLSRSRRRGGRSGRYTVGG